MANDWRPEPKPKPKRRVKPMTEEEFEKFLQGLQSENRRMVEEEKRRELRRPPSNSIPDSDMREWGRRSGAKEGFKTWRGAKDRIQAHSPSRTKPQKRPSKIPLLSPWSSREHSGDA